MNKIENYSLKRGFLFNFLLFSTMPLMIVSFIISIVISYSMITDNYKRNYMLTRILKDEVEYSISIPVRKMRHLEFLVNNKIIKDIDSFLDSIIKNDIIFKSIKITDKNGIIKYMAPYNKEIIGNDISNTSFFNNFNLNNDIKWTDVFVSSIDYSPNVNLVFYSNNYLYIGEINLIYLENLIDHIKIEKNLFPFIIDNDNIFIAHPDKKNVKWRNKFEYSNRKGCSSQWNSCFVTIDNKEYLLNLEPIEETGWDVGIIQPREELYNSVFKASIIIVIGTLLSFGFALFVSLARIKTIFKPMELLTLNSKEISKGNYDILWTNSKYKEINELSGSFKKMIDVIRNREEELRNNEKWIKDLFNNLPIAVCIFQSDGKISFCNIKFREFFGCNNISIDQWLDIFYNHNTYKENILKLILENIDKRDKENLFYNIETQKITTLNNEQKIVDIIFSFYNENIIFNFIDVTEKYKLTEDLKNSLKEKELYLREIHHRVKNNLQIINALLNLQKRKLSEESLIAIFSETQNRILSMATVHEELYRSNNSGKINVKNLINNIVNNLFRTYRMDKPINYKSNLSEVYTTIDISIPLGLIVNEIVSNSLKYAFIDKDEGEININLEGRDGKIILEISDNGKGLKEDFDIEKSDSLGMSLIFNLTTQLNGKITYINKEGLKYLIEVPIK